MLKRCVCSRATMGKLNGGGRPTAVQSMLSCRIIRTLNAVFLNISEYSFTHVNSQLFAYLIPSVGVSQPVIISAIIATATCSHPSLRKSLMR